ncbi:putative bZIP transcription factor (AP-1) [Cladophialophora carrionii]|uniref:Putative bZIP transcription factor (AP-1) n=1 Tax=Cladophialophora carrionii TaxID=86049 RepID=A0A1C1CIE4_9EURO|nr:putative bZIP transcription factor (AP-1) [Cladophialophora carrionii]
MSRQASEGLYLSPEQQDLLMAALNSNQSPKQSGIQKTAPQNVNFTPSMSAPDSGNLDFSDDSPFLDFDPDADFGDDSFDFDANHRMIGDIPDEPLSHDLHDKRKSVDGKDEDDEGGGKRREGEDKTAKKPGRKPLTSEPTSKRKAQNRAAQRAFRERKEKHLKDLETKVEDLEKASESANHENGLLRAQVERLQVELKEYRKRLSWVSSNGLNRSQPISFNQGRNSNTNNHNDFQFEFPKFGDLPPMPGTKLFGNSTLKKPQGNPNRSSSGPAASASPPTQNGNSRRSASSSQSQTPRFGSMSQSPVAKTFTTSPQPQSQVQQHQGSVDSLSGLFSPSILEASRHASLGGYFPQSAAPRYNGAPGSTRGSLDNGVLGNVTGLYSNSSISNSDSPGSSTDSHNPISSIGTSPEPSMNSPANKLTEYNLNPISEEKEAPFGGKDFLCEQLQQACGCVDDPIPPILKKVSNDESLGYTNEPGFDANGINWLAQQNNNSFDPILFGDYRETQENILSQDFGAFFNDAYPLPDLGSPLHNYNDVATESAPKTDLLKQVEEAKNGNEEVVPDNEKPMSCNKIWDRLQSMEKFRNGEIDIDNLCSELRAKAKCSEGGAVVDKKDVDKILGTA